MNQTDAAKYPTCPRCDLGALTLLQEIDDSISFDPVCDRWIEYRIRIYVRGHGPTGRVAPIYLADAAVEFPLVVF